MRANGKLAAAAAVCLITAAAAGATYDLRVDGQDVPLVLTGRSGHGGWTVNWLAVSSDGFVIDYDTGGSGHEFHTLDPANEERNDATTGAAQAALTQIWDDNRQYYRASVAAGVKVAGGDAASSGFTRPTSSDTHLMISGGGNFSLDELQFQNGWGNYDADAGSAARLLNASASIDAGLHKTGIELIAEPDADTYYAIMGTNSVSNGEPIDRPIRKLRFGPLTGLNPGAPAEGNRTLTAGGRLTGGSAGTAQSLIDDLPGDEVVDFAYNPVDENIYFVSNDTAGNRVFLSAVGFDFGNLADDSPAGYVDLDPASADDFVEITYDPDDNPDDLATVGLLRAGALAFNADGTHLYVANRGGAGSRGNRIFQFDLAACHPGDANGDGSVDVFDLAAVANNYEAPGDMDWEHGDFDDTNTVDIFDLAILANNYGWTAAAGRPIPEPAIAGLLGLGAVALLRRRK